ncbi:GNAT family N-acetyltransferase [Pedobacter petrophilus]|uniref:GNAT family N-acetyltransferase n=1 Tax=Pedobacter petrophilus TaxID=1908241 RepID=UPI0012B0C592|nr:GNAT family N-acetyltransferase [Pedobacter petrophilus]
MKKLQTGVAFIYTDRLILIPFTTEILTSIENDEGALLKANKLVYSKGWPDEDALETFPKIKRNLALVTLPTGFESWLIVKEDGLAIIGDAGFKGRPDHDGRIDLGYAIAAGERKNGYALEAAEGLMNWAFQQQGVRAVTASCLKSNAGSAKLLQKLAFKELSSDTEMIYWLKKSF